MAIVAAAVGAIGKPPRIWASARTRTKPLHDDMAKFLNDSGYEKPDLVRVITDGALDLKKVPDPCRMPVAGCSTGPTSGECFVTLIRRSHHSRMAGSPRPGRRSNYGTSLSGSEATYGPGGSSDGDVPATYSIV